MKPLLITPEAAVGGPLAYVRTGDRIRLSVKRREIALLACARLGARGQRFGFAGYTAKSGTQAESGD